MRLIDADALITAAQHDISVCVDYSYSGLHDTQQALRWFVEVLEHAPTIDPVGHGEWIPCSERLPSENKRVLITVCHTDEAEDYPPEPFYEITLDFICQGKWYKHGFFDDYSGETVVAWMPLPEPYKENNHERTD